MMNDIFILTVLLLSVARLDYSLAQFDIRLGFATPKLQDAPSEEEFLNQVIENELDSLELEEPCSRKDDPDSIARRMDRMAERLSMALDVAEAEAEASMAVAAESNGTGTKIQNELADAVGLGEILQVYQPDPSAAVRLSDGMPPKKYRSDLGTRDVHRILMPDNPYIYHGKGLAAEGIMQLAQDLTLRALTDSERQFSSQMFDYASKRADEEPRVRFEKIKKKLQELGSLGGRAVESVYNLADSLYFGTEFLEQIPILGLSIKELKKIGRRPYEIMDTVRYMHQIWSKFSKELPQQESDTRHIFGSEITKKMLTQSGIKALKIIAKKLLIVGVGGGGGGSLASMGTELGAINEIASRCAYYLFSQLVPRSAYCLIGRGFERTRLEQLESEAEAGSAQL